MLLMLKLLFHGLLNELDVEALHVIMCGVVDQMSIGSSILHRKILWI
jgi:hypothetical protein